MLSSLRSTALSKMSVCVCLLEGEVLRKKQDRRYNLIYVQWFKNSCCIKKKKAAVNSE